MENNLLCSIHSNQCARLYKENTPQTFTYSRSAIGPLEKDVKDVQS